MIGVFANHKNLAVATNDFTVVANLLDAGPNFHLCLLRAAGSVLEFLELGSRSSARRFDSAELSLWINLGCYGVVQCGSRFTCGKQFVRGSCRKA